MATNEGSTSLYVNAVGGSDDYQYKLLSGQAQGISLEYNRLQVPTRVAGTYSAVVRVTDYNNAALYCDISCVFYVAQGITIGGCIKDAQGNPIPYGDVDFTNKNRSDRYCRYESASADEKGIYSATVVPGTYDMAVGRSYASDAATGTYYAVNQVLNATRSGFDFTLPLYKVSLVTGDDNISLNRDWYINDEYAGYGSALYLKAGSYTLESNGNGAATTTSNGGWFDGTTVTSTYTPMKYRASVNIVNAAVQAGVVKVADGAPKTYTYNRPAAKNTTSVLEIDAEDSTALPYEYDEYYDENVQTALKVNVTAEGTYRLYSYNNYVKVFDTKGTEVAQESDAYMTYHLGVGTYYIGTGDYDLTDYNISMTTVTESAE